MAEGVITPIVFDAKLADFHQVLEKAYEESQASDSVNLHIFLASKHPEIRLPEASDFETTVDTAISKELFLQLARNITKLPDDKSFSTRPSVCFNSGRP